MTWFQIVVTIIGIIALYCELTSDQPPKQKFIQAFFTIIIPVVTWVCPSLVDKNTLPVKPIVLDTITSYQQIKEDMLNDNNISQVDAYTLDLDADSNDEMVITYKKDDAYAIRIYCQQNNNIVQLCDYNGSISVNNENPEICYMITKENQGYSLRERVKEENKVRNTYYELKDNSLIGIRNIYEKDKYSDVIPKLQKYPIVITTDPVHYPITEGVLQPPKI